MTDLTNATSASPDRDIVLSWTMLGPKLSAKPDGISRLYQCPPKIKDEGMYSWILRIAARYGWTPLTITNFFWFYERPYCEALEFRLNKHYIRHIATATVSSAQLIISRLALGLSQLRRAHCRALGFRADKSVRLRYCPYCLREDEIPYFRLSWQIATTILCERHHTLLLEHCPTCSRRIGWRSNVAPSLSNVNHGEILRYCQKCGRQLDQSTPSRVPDRLGEMLPWFQQLAIQAISRGLQDHQLYGSLNRTEFLDMFLTREQPARVTRGNGSKPSTIWSNHSWVDWKTIVHPCDYPVLREWFHDILEP